MTAHDTRDTVLDGPTRATDTLIPDFTEVKVGDDTFQIRTFCLVKTIRTFALMTELAQAAGISEVVGAANASAQAGEFAGVEAGLPVVAPGFVTKVLAVLPNALKNGEPTLYRLLGLLVTSNRQLEDWETDEVNSDTELLKIGKRLAFRGNTDEIIRLVMGSVQAIGLKTIVQQLPNLAMLLGGGRS